MILSESTFLMLFQTHNHPPATLQPISCIAMLNPYEQDFPPLERRVDQNTRVPSRPYVIPNTVDAQGIFQSTQTEEVLNWQNQNVVCQNTTLRRIDSKLDSLATKTDGLTYQIDQLSEEVKRSQFKQKEIELQAIQQDLKRIELDMAKKLSQVVYEPYPSFSTIPAPLFPSSPTSYPKEADYNKQFKFNHPLFAQLSPPKLPPQTKPQPRTQFTYPRQRPPFFTPFQTYDPGSHSGSKGIQVNEPTSYTSTPVPQSQEKQKQAVNPSQPPQTPSYSTITSTTSSSQSTQTTTVVTPPPHTSAIDRIDQGPNDFVGVCV
ncbi:hypothetical protein K1719_007330 [Acacia pycnantha]|nr:hypothetical protein K1719_007330 [Acacia pycnantha]